MPPWHVWRAVTDRLCASAIPTCDLAVGPARLSDPADRCLLPVHWRWMGPHQCRTQRFGHAGSMSGQHRCTRLAVGNLEASIRMRTRNFLIAALLTLTTLTPAAALASPANGELCAVQTWDQEVVISVHRAGYLSARTAPRAQIEAAAGACTNLALLQGWMPADKEYDEWQGQSTLCAIDVQASLVYRIHAGNTGFSRAYGICSDAAAATPEYVHWV